MSLLEEAENIATQFDFGDDHVGKCVIKFLAEMNAGLQRRMPSMCQIPTYLARVADGTEKGLSLAVDLGGTNLRVCSVDLNGDRTFSLQQSKVSIPVELMTAQTASQLFSFIARRIETFLKTYHGEFLEPKSGTRLAEQGIEPFSLGFTFSYPAYQAGINSGILLRWTKGFDIEDAVEKDVCKLLQLEIDALNLPVRVTALVNDAVGAIISRAYSLGSGTTIGAIIGTGTNGAYLEKLSNITKTLGEHDSSSGEMFISMEWGSFDNELAILPNTPYDIIVNKNSANIGNQMFEKRVSGMFLGELLRLVIVSIVMDLKLPIFNDHKPNDALPLYTSWAVDSSILSVAEADDSAELLSLKGTIEVAFGIPATSISTEDAQAVKIIAHSIGKRAGRLIGMAIGAVVIHTSSLESQSESCFVDVGVDGSVVECYPGFENFMRQAFRAIEGIGLSGEKRIRIGVAKDGSGVGAAIIALLADRQGKRNKSLDLPLDSLSNLSDKPKLVDVFKNEEQ